jgi:hypothetical protein
MPRNVRNWWLELDIDGKTQRIEAGPQSRVGGFTLTIKQRDQGDIVTALEVTGLADGRGNLLLRAEMDACEPLEFRSTRD